MPVDWQEIDFLHTVSQAVAELGHSSTEAVSLSESVSDRLMPWKKRRTTAQMLHDRFDVVMGCFLVFYGVIVFIELSCDVCRNAQFLRFCFWLAFHLDKMMKPMTMD